MLFSLQNSSRRKLGSVERTWTILLLLAVWCVGVEGQNLPPPPPEQTSKAWNLFEPFKRIIPNPVEPSPFVEQKQPKGFIYPTEHTYSQVTVAPSTGTLKANAGTGLKATTMPWIYRPYLNTHNLNRHVEPLVYNSLYSWTPSSPGAGDVEPTAAIKDSLDIFKPRDWKVRIEQPGANVEIQRRGPDGMSLGPWTNVATPKAPAEFYQFTAPTPPTFVPLDPPKPRTKPIRPTSKRPPVFPDCYDSSCLEPPRQYIPPNGLPIPTPPHPTKLSARSKKLERMRERAAFLRRQKRRSEKRLEQRNDLEVDKEQEQKEKREQLTELPEEDKQAKKGKEDDEDE